MTKSVEYKSLTGHQGLGLTNSRFARVAGDCPKGALICSEVSLEALGIVLILYTNKFAKIAFYST